eukprot:TRINITY_DN1514_c0_g1_i1.p1 TRINITY_DN1514_c0_g1~~TRINITY_DN1514_c0_g1_i1.p1  ORF type:complete len:407 (+),score=176.23 TRINITY_DN1514_c0_g1_i1:143-1222(+)
MKSLSSGADEEEAFLCKLVDKRLEYRILFYNVTLPGLYLQDLKNLLQKFESLLSSPVSASVSLLPLSQMTISRLVVLTHFHILKAILSFSPGSSDLAVKLTNLVKAHRDDLEIQLLFLQFAEGLPDKSKDLRDLFSSNGAFDFSPSSSSSTLLGSDEQGQVLKHLLSKHKQVLPDPLSLQTLPLLAEKDVWNEILSSSSSSSSPSSSSFSFGSLDLMSPGAGSVEPRQRGRKSKGAEELIKEAKDLQLNTELHAAPPSPIPRSSLETSYTGLPPTFDFPDDPKTEDDEERRKQEEAPRGHKGYSLKRKSNASSFYEAELNKNQAESLAESDHIISQQFLSIKSVSTLIKDLHNILSSLD